jgi:hypothetical protein
MPEQIIVDIPHKLGRAEAKRRLSGGIGQLTSILPGSSIKADEWQGDVLTFFIEALGQSASSKIEVFDDRIRATLESPLFLALAADRVRKALMGVGQKLLQ